MPRNKNKIGGKIFEKAFDIGYTSDFAVDAKMTNMSETFIKAYKAKYGQNAEPTEAMAVAFDGYIMARAAVEKAYNDILATDFEALAKDSKVTQEQIKKIRTDWLETQQYGFPSGSLIREALANLKNFEGASGTIRYEGTNEPNKTIVVNHNLKGEVQIPVTEEDEDVVKDTQDAGEDTTNNDKEKTDNDEE
jgi:ABC-type branched-subunit amino acid transport system substrate-binding protein